MELEHVCNRQFRSCIEVRPIAIETKEIWGKQYWEHYAWHIEPRLSLLLERVGKERFRILLNKEPGPQFY